MKALKIVIGILFLITLMNPSGNTDLAFIPDTGEPALLNTVPDSVKPVTSLTLDEFVTTILDGDASSIRGIFVEKSFALKVVQQPANQPGFVSTLEGVATQFHDVKKFGSIGILAHNYLSGKYFYQLNLGDTVHIIYGDGSIKKYRIEKIYQFQALQPNNPRSNFVDLSNGTTISASNLFVKMYTGQRHLTLQTCLQKDDELSWGRHFIIATPMA